MSNETTHNPDRFMFDLRQILSQGRKRIGLFVGAGAPVSIRVSDKNELDGDGNPLIPDVAGLTEMVLAALPKDAVDTVDKLRPELGDKPNIETILTRIRRLSQAIGTAKVHDVDGIGYEKIAELICLEIGKIVAASLPSEPNAYTELVSWIGGTNRDHAVEIFTPNYDLLMEEAFERARLPYFDGFTGAHRPFFDPTSITDDQLPARWSRIWKLHGSLGWDVQEESIVRTGSREATKLIYPDHLKYDQITRQPYSAMFERLREFLTTPDTLLLCAGFSFFDDHIRAVIDEALAANNHTAVIAFQFSSLDTEGIAASLAHRRPNMSVYARDGAVIFGVPGQWKPGQLPAPEWLNIRSTFWRNGEFLLGDFVALARFCALAQAVDFRLTTEVTGEENGAEAKPEPSDVTPAEVVAGSPDAKS